MSNSSQNEENANFQIAESFVKYTARNVFLTGKAGTGKTTFLKHIVSSIVKNTVVAAPTGVAAINAGGVTLHSLFQLPFGPYVPENVFTENGNVNSKNSLISKIRFNATKRKLIKEMELLIIDEISMVRADMLDAMDVILKHLRKNQAPFGGLQVLMIGDMFQLPPVTSNQDWQILGRYYQSPYFFSAKVIEEGMPICVELKKIYRQSDERFVNLLNDIRMANLGQEGLNWLNEKYAPEFSPGVKDQFITLSTHNHKAQTINQTQLKQLSSKSFQFKATIEGEFLENAYPVAERLELKEGAQVIFTKNDREEPRRYYNGKIGVISDINKDFIKVSFPEEQVEITVEEEEWKNIRYSLNEEKGEIEEVELGSFKQYPLKLAWAITIHKSQGLTFQRAVVDAGESFSSGQVYVALSRLTSIDGLVLKSKVTAASIKTDRVIVDFSRQIKESDQLLPLLEQDRQHYIRNVLVTTFDWEPLLEVMQQQQDYLLTAKIPIKGLAQDLAHKWQHGFRKQKKVASSFVHQLIGIFQDNDLEMLKERMEKAVSYFNEVLDNEVLSELKKHEIEVKSKKSIKAYSKLLFLLNVKVKHKKDQLQQALLLATGLANGAESHELLVAVNQYKKESKEKIVETIDANNSKKKEKGESQRITLTMFKEGKSILEIATEREYAFSTIEGHMIGFVKSGDIPVTDLVKKEKLTEIQKIIAELDTQSISEVKKAMSDDYTYGEIRAVFGHIYYETNK